MRLEKFKNMKFQKISDSIIKNYPSISYAVIQKLLRQKDVKVNGKRVSEDVQVEIGDEIIFYINQLRTNVIRYLCRKDYLHRPFTAPTDRNKPQYLITVNSLPTGTTPWIPKNAWNPGEAAF